MFINELRKKNYFRYLQLQILNPKFKDNYSIIFLIEITFHQIFNSTNEKNIRIIKYQWMLEELQKEDSKHEIINETIKLSQKFNIKKNFLEIILKYQKLSDLPVNNNNFLYIFEEIANNFNLILYKINKEFSFKIKTNFFFQLFYFIYNLKEKDFSSKEFIDLYINNRDLKINFFERTFCDYFVKVEKKKSFKISKLKFIYLLFFAMFKK